MISSVRDPLLLNGKGNYPLSKRTDTMEKLFDAFDSRWYAKLRRTAGNYRTTPELVLREALAKFSWMRKVEKQIKKGENVVAKAVTDKRSGVASKKWWARVRRSKPLLAQRRALLSAAAKRRWDRWRAQKALEAAQAVESDTPTPTAASRASKSRPPSRARSSASHNS